MFDIKEAQKPGAHTVLEEYPDNRFTPSRYTLKKGDPEAGFAEADFIIEREYETQYVEHAYIEPEAAVAIENPSNGEMTVHASAQNPFFTRRYVADILQIPLNRVRLLQETLGGSFGGKEEGAWVCSRRAAHTFAACCTARSKWFFRARNRSSKAANGTLFSLPIKRACRRDGRICSPGKPRKLTIPAPIITRRSS